jgi:hypothetical protein
MTDLYKPISDGNNSTAKESHPEPAANTNEAGRTLLIGMLGGIVSAAGYLIYTRLPDEQKDKLNAQVRTVVESRVNEFRSKLNF